MTRDDGTEGPAASVHAYRCPYCPAEYPAETLTRVHVSYAEDERHEGRDGMTPEVEPVECDADGEPVGTAFTLAGQLNLHGLSLSDMPGRYRGRVFDERERRALLVAAFNANKALAVTELQDLVTSHLAERDLEPLSTRELRDLCTHVFRPHAAGTDGVPDSEAEITTAETTLRELTALQQAIIVAHLARPAASRRDLATAIGTADSYPGQVINARADLVARLQARVERTSLDRLVAERVPGADLAEIREEGYLDAFELDLDAVIERRRRGTNPTGSAPAFSGAEPTHDGTDRAPSVSGPEPDTEPETPAARRGSERSERGDTQGPEDADPDPADSTGGWDGTATDGRAGGDGQPAPESRPEGVPRAEVEAVRDQIAFDLAVVEQEMALADPTPQQVRTKAYLQQILERLDELLESR